MKLSPQDRDLTIRTVLGEAADQPLAGQAAVASVIFNRANSPQWGGSPSSVVLAPNQFEPWSTRARELLNIDPNSPEYQEAGKVVDGVASGQIPDPTNGATYFLAPKLMQARGTPNPAWATGPSMTIGGHQFFYGPGGPRKAALSPDGPKEQPMNGSAPAQSGGAASGVTEADIATTMKTLGLKMSGGPAGSTSAAKPGMVPVSSGGGITISVPAGGASPSASVSPDDVAATAKTLGLKLDNPQTEVTPPAKGAPTPAPDTGYQPSYSQQMIEGVPVVGPLFDKALAAAGAATTPALNYLRRAVGQPPIPGQAPTFGGRYTANLADINRKNAQFEAAHPIGSTVANLAGGAAMMGPMAATELGGAALGTYGPTMASRIVTGAMGGGGLGALDAALRGHNPLSGAELGAAGGAVGPAVGEALGTGLNYIGRNVMPRVLALRSYTPDAINRLIHAFSTETPASLSEAERRMGPAGFVGDINPAFTDIAGGIADTPGPGKRTVREAYQARAHQQRDRVEKAITDAYGIRAGVNINDFNKFLTESRAAAADPLYEQYRAMPVHPTQELKDLVPRLEAAGALSMGEELSGISGRPFNKNYFTGGNKKDWPTAEGWDYVKRGLDRRIDQAYAAGDKTLGRELVNLKKELVSEIEKTDAGKVWKQARTEFADRSAIMDQLAAGRDDFIGGRSGLSADELADELSTLRGPELAARKVGQRKAIEEAVGDTLRGDTTLRNKLLAPNNRAKLELTLGKAKADKLIEALEQEKYLGDQYQNVVGGSQTTPKKERVNALAAPAMEPWDLDVTKPMSYLPPSMRQQFTPHGLVNAWRGQAAAKTAEQLAPLVTTPQGDPRYGHLIRALVAEGRRRAPWEAAASRLKPVVTGAITGPLSPLVRRRLENQARP